MPAKRVKWGRSEEGYVFSKCGRYIIDPVFWGRERPHSYRLSFGKQQLSEGHWTIRDAKAAAEAHARKEAPDAAR